MAKLLNVVLGSLTCSMVYALGRMMWGRSVGIVAGTLLTVFPSHIFYSTMVLTEVTYGTVITAIFLAFFWRLRRSGGALDLRYGFLLGIATGVAAMIRGEAILLPLVFGAVIWVGSSRRRGAAFAGVVVFGLAVIISGWTLRNVVQMGSPILISTGSSRMAQAHWDGADGGPNDDRVRELNALYPDVPFPEREVKISQYSMRQGLKFMVTHPVKELSLVPQRLYFLYRHDHAAIDLIARRDASLSQAAQDRLRTAADAYYFGLVAWALVGVCLWWRVRREVALTFIGLVGSLSALVGIFYAGIDRYHASFVPFISLMAAPVIVMALNILRDAQGTAESDLSGRTTSS